MTELQALMHNSQAPRDARWRSRYDDIPRSVRTALEKLGSRAKADEAMAAAAGAEMVCIADVEMEALDWLWPNRFALGKLGLIVGLPDVGKGQVLADMAARVTRGNEWPCHEGVAPLGNVILFSAEDAPADTIVPRLASAGADLDRV